MSLNLSGEITAIATAVLAVFAIITAVYAVRAFRKQSQEVSDQANLLKVQSDQLAEQRNINARQTDVLELQVAELRESLDERKREAGLRYRDQASRVFIAETHQLSTANVPSVTAFIKNTSDQPIYRLELRWHCGSAGYGEPNPEPLGDLMPGVETNRTRDFPPGTNIAVSGAVVIFRDGAGVTWIRRPDGGLTEQR